VLFFNKNKGPVVGLDISSSSVKAMEFSQTSNGYRVDHYGVEPLPSNAVTEKVISDVDAVGESQELLFGCRRFSCNHQSDHHACKFE